LQESTQRKNISKENKERPENGVKENDHEEREERTSGTRVYEDFEGNVQ
jgi:hypothetical protein